MTNNINNSVNNNIDSYKYINSPSTKSFSGVEGMKGNARLTRPSYQSGNNTWVSEYRYKDSDIDVVIRQKVKIASHNGKILGSQFVQNEVVEVSNSSPKKADSASEFSDLPKNNVTMDEAESTLKDIKERMLQKPMDAMNAQARQARERVMALIMQ